MLRKPFAASLLLPMAVLGRGKNDATSAESAFTTVLVDDSADIKLHHWTINEGGTWRFYGEIEARMDTAIWMILWWIF